MSQTDSPRIHQPETEIYYYDLIRKSRLRIDLDSLAAHMQRQTQDFKNCVFVFQMLDDEYIREIRKFFKMHPIIDKECSNSALNTKDVFLEFEDYFLLTLSDTDMDHNVENPYSLKMIVFAEFILIFTNGPMICLDEIFTKHLSFVS